MDKIPFEVFTNIASNLSYKERLTLSLVNHHWHDMITTTNLFNSFKIKGKMNFNTAMTFFENQKQYCKQVRNLCLIKPFASIDHILSIPSLFPFLKEFYWADYGNLEVGDMTILTETIQAWQHLEFFGESNRHSLSATLLRSGGFANLTELKINYHFGVEECTGLFENLEKAPKLDRLELTSIATSLHAMELLHKNTPNLTTLFLSHGIQEAHEFDSLYEHEQQELSNISEVENTFIWERRRDRLTKPANKLKSIRFNHMMMGNRTSGLESHWMAYIARKYVKLESLVIDGVGMGSTSEPYYEGKLVDIIGACRDLKTYKVNICSLTSSILDTMDKNQIKLKEVDILSDVEAQLKDVVNSDQKHYIHQIHFAGDQIYNDNILTCLQQFSNLRTLLIESSNSLNSVSYVPVDILICKLRNLESLSLLSCEVGLDNKEISTVSGLKSLTMERALIVDDSVIDFVSKNCLGLSRLTIRGKVQESEAGVFQIHFVDQFFSSLRVLILGNEYYKVDNGIEAVCYKFKGGLFQQCNNIQDYFHVSIKYKGLAALNIGGVNVPKWC